MLRCRIVECLRHAQGAGPVLCPGRIEFSLGLPPPSINPGGNRYGATAWNRRCAGLTGRCQHNCDGDSEHDSRAREYRQKSAPTGSSGGITAQHRGNGNRRIVGNVSGRLCRAAPVAKLQNRPETGKGLRKRCASSQADTGILRQHDPNSLTDVGRKVRSQRCKRDWLLVDMPEQHRHFIVRRERHTSGEHLERDHTECVKVGRGGCRPTPYHFWGKVFGSSRKNASPGSLAT